MAQYELVDVDGARDDWKRRNLNVRSLRFVFLDSFGYAADAGRQIGGRASAVQSQRATSRSTSETRVRRETGRIGLPRRSVRLCLGVPAWNLA